jgi:hypothetical protein
MRRSLRLEAKNEKLLNVKKNVAINIHLKVNIIACPIVKKTKKKLMNLKKKLQEGPAATPAPPG